MNGNNINVLERLVEWSNGIEINANDIFFHGAYSFVVDWLDVPKLLEMQKLYGEPGAIAFMSNYCKLEPLDKHQGLNYKLAKRYLKDYVIFDDNENSKEYQDYFDKLNALIDGSV